MNFVLSVVIPCYNEKDNILSVIQNVLSSPIPQKEIIVVDDCSIDGTRDILKNEVEPLVAKVLYHSKNQGKGAALHTGFTYVTGDVVIVQDADLEYDPNDYSKIVQPIVFDACDVCYGSRFLNQKRKGYLVNQWANYFVTKFANLFTGLSMTDVETCYKCFRTDILKSLDLVENRFGFDPEVTIKMSKINGIRVKEVPISYFPRTKEEGKKIGLRDGLRALYCICKYGMKK